MALCACSRPPEVALSDQCTPETDAVRIAPLGAGGRWTVALLDGSLLFSQMLPIDAPDRQGRAEAWWLDESLRPVTDTIWLGDSELVAPWTWVAHEGRLWAQIYAVTDTEPMPPARLQIGIYSIAAGETAFERRAVDLPLVTSLDRFRFSAPFDLAAPALNPGVQGRAPASVISGRPVFALSAIHERCGHFAFANALRLLLFDGSSVFTNLPAPDPCNERGGVGTSGIEGSPTLVAHEGGGGGVFYRIGDSIGSGRLFYSRVGADLTLLDSPPFEVGSTRNHWPIPGGYQAWVAQVDSGDILFTERSDEVVINSCVNLRMIHADGTDARDGPFQLACWPRHGRAPVLTAWTAVSPLQSGHAVIAWGERTNFALGSEYLTRLTTSTEWEEGVFFATVDGNGSRASEIVRATPPDATAINGAEPRTESFGPLPGDFEVQMTSEGNTVVVAWSDLRADAPGYYARRFRCAPLD